MTDKPFIQFGFSADLPLPEEIKKVQDIAEQVTDKLALDLARVTDMEIEKALSMRLRRDFEPEELRGRLHRMLQFTGGGDVIETYYLDGEALIQFGPIVVNTHNLQTTATRSVTHLKGKNEPPMQS